MVYQRKYRLRLLCLLTNSKCVPIKLYKEDCGKWDLKLNFAKVIIKYIGLWVIL